MSELDSDTTIELISSDETIDNEHFIEIYKNKYQEHMEQIKEEKGTNIKFHNKWDFWFHYDKNNWKINGYRKLFTIETIKDYWNLHNNFDKLGGLANQHYFLMRDGILPIWEDKRNKNGGCWSFKINFRGENRSESLKIVSEQAVNLWNKLTIYMLGETLTENSLNINGLSICLKTHEIIIIKIWIKDAKYCDINLLPLDIQDSYKIIFQKNDAQY